MATAHIYLKDSDNIIEVMELKNAVTDAYLNSATVTVTLKDSATGLNISGETWPLSMTYIPASDGGYRATLGYDLVVYEDQKLTIDIVADGGAGLRRRWQLPGIVHIGYESS